jgi:hypothetical protein
MPVTRKVNNNHQEPLFTSELELKIEELEQILAPTPSIPIPPPLR